MKRPELLGVRERQERRSCRILLIAAVLFVILVFALDIWFSQNFLLVIVDGTSMEDTLQDGDALYVNVNKEVGRGDIIVINVTSRPDLFPHGAGEERFIIKRAIAFAGDEIYAEGGVVYLKTAGETSFSALDEPYTKGVTRSFGPVTVGEGEVFFLGDHRTLSEDSSIVGTFPLSDVLGVVSDFSLSHIDFVTGWVHFWHPTLA